MPAYGKNISNAGHRLELKLDYPVVDFPEVGIGGFTLGIRPIIEGEVIQENLAEAGGYRPEYRRFMHIGQIGHSTCQPLAHQLSREINIDVVLEIYVYNRHTEGGCRFDLHHIG